MAWITKNSAGMQIERRAEPYLTDELKKELERDVMPRYPEDHRRAAALPVMHAIQEEHGWLPMQAIEEAAAMPIVCQTCETELEDDHLIAPNLFRCPGCGGLNMDPKTLPPKTQPALARR